MKELISTNAAHYLAMGDDKAIPVVELTLVLAVSNYVPDGQGGFVNKHKPETIAMGVKPSGLRRLAENLLELAEECDALAARYSPPPAGAELPQEEQGGGGELIPLAGVRPPGSEPAAAVATEVVPLGELTRAGYNKLKDSGELTKLYPNATGDYARDTGLN